MNYGNRTDKLGKMAWSEFSTKALHKTILDIDDWDRIRVNIQKKIHLKNRIHPCKIKYIYDIISPIYLKEERKKSFKFPQE